MRIMALEMDMLINSMRFRNYIELIESVKDFEFTVEINDITYKVIRDSI